MNRQERYAYDLGWAARCLGLPLEITDLPIRDTVEEEVKPGQAWRVAAARGYQDAVCECGHVELHHEKRYGCHDESEELEGIECPCTEFKSATRIGRQEKRRRLAQRRAAAAARRREQEEGQ